MKNSYYLHEYLGLAYKTMLNSEFEACESTIF